MKTVAKHAWVQGRKFLLVPYHMIGAHDMGLYTTPFDDRFFFEIIERRGNYQGYGAVNAMVRLAALASWRATNEGPGSNFG